MPIRPCAAFLGLALICLLPAGGVASAQESPSRPSGAARRQIPDDLALAHGLFRQRKFDLAAEEYEKFLGTGPSRADADDARFGLASARLFQGRYKEARRAFRDFLDKAPDHPRARTAWYRLGELGYMLGDLDAARAALESFVADPAKHANLETAWTYLGDVRLGLGDLRAARDAYERSLALFPNGPLADRARYGIGRALSDLGETDAAVKAFAELAARKNDDWSDRAYFQMARVQAAAGRHAEAVKSLEDLARRAPRSSLKHEADLLRAEELIQLGRGPEADPLLRPLAAEAGEPLAPRAALVLATSLLGREEADAARRLLDAAVEKFPRSPLAPALIFRSGEALAKQGKVDEARRRFAKVADWTPPDEWSDDALSRAARLAVEARDHDEAIRLARSFSDRFADSPLTNEVMVTESRALIETGRASEAVKILEPLVGLDGDGSLPKDTPAAGGRLSPATAAAARFDLVRAYREAKHPEKASALLGKMAGAGATPLAAEAQFLVGQDLAEKGRHAEAIGPLMAYLQANPRGDVADAALAQLAAAQASTGKLDDAEKSLADLATRFPRSKGLAPTRLRIAEADADAGRDAHAADLFRLILSGKASEAGPNSPQEVDPAILGRARLGLARALWKLDRPAEAAPFFADYLKGSAKDAAAPAAALDLAAVLAASGRTQDAIEAYRSLADAYPQSPQRPRADLARARLLVSSGHPKEGAEVYAAILAAGPRPSGPDATGGASADLLAELGWALIEARQSQEADAAFERLLKEHPTSPRALEARFNLAESASEAGQPRRVLEILEPATAAKAGGTAPSGAADRFLPLILYRKARTQAELDDWAGASATAERLNREYPSHPRAREARFLGAEAALRLGRAEAAEAEFAALEAQPEAKGAADPDGLSRLIRERHVQSLLGVKRWKDALDRAEALKKELPATDPALADLDLARGRALLGLGRPDDARNAFQAVIAARKGSELAAQALLLRGETYFHQDRFREALAEYLKVDALYDAPRWEAAALLEAGKVYERLQQWADAAETYDRLCKDARFRDDPHASEAKARLEAARRRGASRP
ncbi:tetratricopeptide repeat protein [Aquisphaera giovannonii]|uniref:tetratricopeptide repeat protein n=1 Tax=Aquisphaera giovannonii TaxID=406548 RepID=UPI00143D7416|nr:tetratricopeptide repeat protein [Aquisphaera giovannonii]